MMAQHEFDDWPGHNAPARRRRPVRAALAAVLVFALLAALAAGGYLFALARSFESKAATISPAFPEEGLRPVTNATGATNILLLGSDSRGTGGAASAAGLPHTGRSDTIMLVHFPGDGSGAYVASILRDTWVEIPGHGSNKINAAFAYGGVPLAVLSLEALLQTRIDHVAALDMEGFKGLTDALGGVEVDVPVPFAASQLKGHHFAGGRQAMDGAQALAFVRERKAFADGDYQRVRNQQAFLKALLGELASPQTLANPATVWKSVGQISPYLAVDDSLDAAAAGRLGLSMLRSRSGDMHFFTLPTLGTGRSADGQSVVLPDTAAIAALAGALADDDVAGFVRDHGL
ncbi:transcriptional regulator [Zafaria cholistanensis]|uniref:Transcriptional regulator n=1 Tax=Zafaria cholistanensis TaxID=1682741 RepID=A0A5A7NMX6_9MICC|nr:LCP family protein [Zafaria cholistanensis]GER21909.1 transcriptional regulator [Zafaria cholistanensis]